jgi:hypothetical protein
MSQHHDYHYSVTVHTDDLALLGCMRALSQHCQRTGNPRIPWGGTKQGDWEQTAHRATFHFSSPAYRSDFLAEAQRLLPAKLWQEVSMSDSDPAVPQSAGSGS